MKARYVHMIMNGRRQAAQRRFLKRGVIRRCLTLGLAAVLGLMVAVPVAAAGKADAQEIAGTTTYLTAFGGSTMLAQTFTAQTTGSLDEVDLPFGTPWNGAGSIYIVAVDPTTAVNGDPTTAKPSRMTGPSFGTYMGAMSCCAAYGTYPISPAYKVTANGHYAIVVVPKIGSSVSWAVVTSASDNYSGGQLWFGNQPSTWSHYTFLGYDFDFITYVTPAATTPPPPANTAPTIKANLDTFQATEGAVPTASGTYSDPDGDTVTLSASALTGAAGTVTPGPAGTWSWKGAAADEGQGQAITITADDGHGHKATAQFSTVVGDSTPAVAISFTQPWLIVSQQSLTFNGTFTDAGVAMDAYYTPTWKWSDNYPSPNNLDATRTFSAAGTYTATLTVTDDETVAGSATTTVTVLTPAAALAKIAGLVSSQSGLNAGQKNSLLAKLNAATDAAQRGDTGPACNQLNAFVNEVETDQKAGRISSGDAGIMTDFARKTQRSLGCFRTLVEFLSGL